MIAFFVMSNLQLINVVNIKSNLYSNQTADIFVSLSNRVSKGLVDSIQKSNLFSNVYLLDATNAIKDIDLTKKFELSSIFGVIHEKNIYDAYLCQLPEKSY